MEDEEPTCGRGLSQSSEVPAALAAVAASLAQNLELHVHALDVDDPAAGRERDAYERVALSLRTAATDLRAAAAEMLAARDLPMGAHDMEVLRTPGVLSAFDGYVASADQLRRLLDAERSDNELMLAAMRSEIKGPGVDEGRRLGNRD